MVLWGSCLELLRGQLNTVPLARAGSEKFLQFTQGKLELSLGGGIQSIFISFWLLSGSGSKGEHVLCIVSVSFQSIPNSGGNNCIRAALPGEHYYQFSYFSDFTSAEHGWRVMGHM